MPLTATARLRAAVRARDTAEAVRLVREEGADPNTLYADGWSAIHIAAEGGDASLVRLLCSAVNGGDENLTRRRANCSGRGKRTPLHLAAREGHLAAVQCLVELGGDVNCANYRDETPLWMAARQDHLAVVRFLVANGANVDAADLNFWTPLVVAAHEGRLPMVILLTSAGADCWRTSSSGSSPMSAAAVGGRSLVVELFASVHGGVNAGEGCWPPIVAAACGGHAKTVAVLLEWGADALAVHSVEEPCTAMFEAAVESNADAVAVLAAAAAAFAGERGGDWNSCV